MRVGYKRGGMKEKKRTGTEPKEHGPSFLCTAPVWELSHELLSRFLGRGVCRCILAPGLGPSGDSRREPVMNWFRSSVDLRGEGGDGAPTQCPCRKTGLGGARRGEAEYVRSKEIEDGTSTINNEAHAEFTQRSCDSVKLVVLIIDDWDSKEEA